MEETIINNDVIDNNVMTETAENVVEAIPEIVEDDNRIFAPMFVAVVAVAGIGVLVGTLAYKGAKKLQAKKSSKSDKSEIKGANDNIVDVKTLTGIREEVEELEKEDNED